MNAERDKILRMEEDGGMETGITEIEAALKAENWMELDHLAHALKGNSLATGDNSVADVAIALRVAAKMSDKDTAQSLFEKLKVLVTEI